MTAVREASVCRPVEHCLSETGCADRRAGAGGMRSHAGARERGMGLVSVLVASLLLLHSPVLLAGDRVRQFALYMSPAPGWQDCRLVERRSSSREEKHAIAGKVVDSGCNVAIDKRLYEQSFGFCFLAGINVYKSPHIESHECFVQQRQQDYVFRAGLSGSTDPESQVMCYFSCVVP